MCCTDGYAIEHAGLCTTVIFTFSAPMLIIDLMMLGLFCAQLCRPNGKQRCFREFFLSATLCLRYSQVIHSDSHRCHWQSGIYPIRGFSSPSHETHGVYTRWTFEFVDDVTPCFVVCARRRDVIQAPLPFFFFRCGLVTLTNGNNQLVFGRD